MRKFIHNLLFKISNFKLSNYIQIEVGSAPSETKW